MTTAGPGSSGAGREFAMPEGMRGRADAWLAGDLGNVPEARPAATVLLVRPGRSGPRGSGVDVFLMHRQATMAFAAGMYVFPGGGVDPRDADVDVPWSGPSPQDWGHRLGCTPVQARELVCAAVRETFEECGVLLAGPSQADVVADVTGADWESDRQSLLTRDVALSELLARRRLVLRSDLLRPWAHWITPEFEPRRYDTRFFLAAVPPGQKARHVAGGEAANSGWWPPAEVLQGVSQGRMTMLPPTVVAVEDVAAASSVEELLRARRDVLPVMPRLEVSGSGADKAVRLLVELPG